MNEGPEKLGGIKPPTNTLRPKHSPQGSHAIRKGRAMIDSDANKSNVEGVEETLEEPEQLQKRIVGWSQDRNPDVRQMYGGKGLFVHIEPSDGTRYEFLIMRSQITDQRGLMIASVGSVGFRGYAYDTREIRDYLARAEGRIGEDVLFTSMEPPASGGERRVLDYFLAYMSEDEHSSCNPWTARAACLAAQAYFAMEAS